MHQLTDPQLIQRYHDGDRAALGVLLERHQPRLYNTILRMVSNPDDAAEVTQDTLLKIVQHIDDYRNEAKFTTWITRIAMNQAISRLRRRKLRNHASLDATASGQDNERSSMAHLLADGREPTPDDRVSQDEMHRDLHEAIGRLDEPFRSVLVLRDLQDMDYQEIADTLDLALGTVKSRLFRARLALRDQLLKVQASRQLARRQAVHQGQANQGQANQAQTNQALR